MIELEIQCERESRPSSPQTKLFSHVLARTN
nr:MAG TPA: hypothetical protein [Bacteriophage sp.]